MKKKNEHTMDPEPATPEVIPMVDEAFEEIFKMDSAWSLEERFDRLIEAMTASAFYLMDRQKRTGKKINDAERSFQEEGMAQLNMISKCWGIARKHGRVPKETSFNDFDNNLLAKIVKMKSTVGDIVRDIPPPTGTGDKKMNNE